MYYIKRFSAALIDVGIITLILFVIVKLKNMEPNLNDESVPSIIFIPCFYLYFIIQEILFKTTLGKRIFSLRVTYPRDLVIFRIVLRNMFNLLELLLPILYIIPVLLTGNLGVKKPRKFGDFLSGCLVE